MRLVVGYNAKGRAGKNAFSSTCNRKIFMSAFTAKHDILLQLKARHECVNVHTTGPDTAKLFLNYDIFEQNVKRFHNKKK